MSCVKCGSDWVTATGRNCASCPHCCKQARCKARKEGRWKDEIPPRKCMACGSTFTPSLERRGAKICSDNCKQVHRKKWAKKHMKAYRQGVRMEVQVHGEPMPTCKRCGKEVSERRLTYCGRDCYNAAKMSGDLSWDRTGQQLGDIRKRRAQGLQMPSQVMSTGMQNAMATFLNSIETLHKSINKRLPCKHCGGPLKPHATERTEFCSIPCAASYEHEIHCRMCGVRCIKRGKQGGRGMCTRCKRVAKTANRRKGYRRKINRICERDGWRCQLCNRRLLKEWIVDSHDVPHPRSRTLDHITPQAAGGTDDDWNLQACCFRCNCRKGSKLQGQLRLRV